MNDIFGGKPLVFVDVETTGVSPRRGARILEIGALRVENNIIADTYNSFVDPGCDVPPVITSITGIQNEDVYGAPNFTEIEKELRNLFKDAIFIAHNVMFDYSFFLHEFERVGHKFIMPKLCTVRLSRAMHPTYRGHSLSAIIEREQFTVKRRHRAFDDAEVLFKYCERMIERDIARFNAVAPRLTY